MPTNRHLRVAGATLLSVIVVLITSVGTAFAASPSRSHQTAAQHTRQHDGRRVSSASSRESRAKTSAAATTSGTAANLGLPSGLSGTWNETFDDEFTGTSLDETKWNPNWYGTSTTLPSAGVEPSTDNSCLSPSEIGDSSGELSLGVSTNACTADNGVKYSNTGSLINTWNKYEYTYGYAEARIYVPTSSTGQLINSVSLWADGTGTWPATGEMDVMELLEGCGPNGGPGYAYHFISPSGKPGECAPTSFDTGGWHTFASDWTAGKVTYYYDGKDVGSITQGITGSPMYLILSQSVNTTWASPIVQSAQARVDWVRVFQQHAA